MSRIGKLPVNIPQGVQVKIDGRVVSVKGPKGELSLTHNGKVDVIKDGDSLQVNRLGDDRESRASHGLYQRLLCNMVEGVTNGYKRELEIVGVGYRAQMDGNAVIIQAGLSHQPRYVPPEGVKLSAPKPNEIVIEGVDKQKVGQAAADIRKIRPPEPYKGKGIRYKNERIRRKVGKTGAK